ncbi:MAG: glycosyltransferase family 2 protein [Acidobacteriia bacterium]|nr:glycosyltransferase family 2 protein [Terriglobia bacterium]
MSRNRMALLRECLESLEMSKGREGVQVIIVDNGSTDGSAQLEADFPDGRFFRLPKNFGLTKAMNIGWRAAEADYVFFLHDDTQLEPDAIERLAAVLDSRPDAAAVCPLLVNEAGQPAPQIGNLPPDGSYRPAEVSGSEPVEVPYARGAALMLRAFVIKSIRQLDERYGQFGTDADLAAHIRRGGKKILLVPEARVRHAGGGKWDSLRRGDFLLGQAVFLGKYAGFGAALKLRIRSIVGPLFSFNWGVLRSTVGGQKIDGTQE